MQVFARQHLHLGRRERASRDKIDSAPSGATLTVAATANRRYPLGSRLDGIRVGSRLAQQLRQLGDIHCDPSPIPLMSRSSSYRQIFAKSNASWSNLGLTLDRRRFRAVGVGSLERSSIKAVRRSALEANSNQISAH